MKQAVEVKQRKLYFYNAFFQTEESFYRTQNCLTQMSVYNSNTVCVLGIKIKAWNVSSSAYSSGHERPTNTLLTPPRMGFSHIQSVNTFHHPLSFLQTALALDFTLCFHYHRAFVLYFYCRAWIMLGVLSPVS